MRNETKGEVRNRERKKLIGRETELRRKLEEGGEKERQDRWKRAQGEKP